MGIAKGVVCFLFNYPNFAADTKKALTLLNLILTIIIKIIVIKIEKK